MNTSNNYDSLFKNVIPNAVGGIKIFGINDHYLKSQNYNNVTNLENKIWADLFQELKPWLDQYASKEYLLGLKSLPIPIDRFPNFEEISPLIANSTGWELIPVAGFLDETLFFHLNSKKQFPVTDIIRKSPRFDEKYSEGNIKNDAGYTPEPDIFHDVQAHVPFLMNSDYAQFLADMGQFGYELLIDHRGLGRELVNHNLKRLQNFAWWTYEFGLVSNSGLADKYRIKNNDIEYEVYGTGIISSLHEIQNVVGCAKGETKRSKFIPFDIEEIAMTCFDYSNIQDRYYVVDSMETLYRTFRENLDIFRFSG